jgi:hypothetical protein
MLCPSGKAIDVHISANDLAALAAGAFSTSQGASRTGRSERRRFHFSGNIVSFSIKFREAGRGNVVLGPR